MEIRFFYPKFCNIEVSIAFPLDEQIPSRNTLIESGVFRENSSKTSKGNENLSILISTNKESSIGGSPCFDLCPLGTENHEALTRSGFLAIDQTDKELYELSLKIQPPIPAACLLRKPSSFLPNTTVRIQHLRGYLKGS